MMMFLLIAAGLLGVVLCVPYGRRRPFTDGQVLRFIQSFPHNSAASISKGMAIGSSDLYPALQRLEETELVLGYWSEPDDKGNRRRLYATWETPSPKEDKK